jgi:hypothetical protein
VYYVGATRARARLVVASIDAWGVDRLPSGRVFRFARGPGKWIQLEIGRENDVDRFAHLTWSDAADVQLRLARCASRTFAAHARSLPDAGYRYRLALGARPASTTDCEDIAELSVGFRDDLGQVWSRVDPGSVLRPPPNIQNLRIIGLTTVALSDDQRGAIQPPMRESGFALAPVVCGFPAVPFFSRRGKQR